MDKNEWSQDDINQFEGRTERDGGGGGGETGGRREERSWKTERQVERWGRERGKREEEG